MREVEWRFVAACVRAGWSDVSALLLLRRRTVRLHRLYEGACNGYKDARGNWDNAAATRAQCQIESTEADIVTMAPDGWGVLFQSDPRGWPVSLVTPGGNETGEIGVPIG